MKKVLVTGGTGFIGKRVCDSLQEKDYAVNVVSRDTEHAKTKLQNIDQIYAWNPETKELPSEATSDLYAVIHLAGETIAGRWNAKKSNGYVTVVFFQHETLFPRLLHLNPNQMSLFVLQQ